MPFNFFLFGAAQSCLAASSVKKHSPVATACENFELIAESA
jgi:hypothetical protein